MAWTANLGVSNILGLVFITEIEKGKRLDDDVWTQEGAPNTNCWYISHPEGKPSKVEENGAEYTERGSLALCQANSHSWYWDSANTRLYVHTTGSNNPAIGTYVILSFIWSRIGSEAVVLNSKFYLPYLNRDSVPSVTLETKGYHEGGTHQDFGSIKYINADGYFDSELTNYIYEGKKIICMVGNRGDAYAEYTNYWVGWTGDIGWSDEEIEVGIEDLRTNLP